LTIRNGEALAMLKQAAADMTMTVSKHANQRLMERKISRPELLVAIASAGRCQWSSDHSS